MSSVSPERLAKAKIAPRRTGSRSRVSPRAYVGPEHLYDILEATQFNLLTVLGMRETSSVLDIGCGSLRLGRLLIPFLRPGLYYGLEPERRLVDAAIEEELGADLIRLRRPVFRFSDDLRLSAFERTFDLLVAQSILSHASQSQVRMLFEEASKVLHEGSVLIATFLEGEQDYAGESWVYPECVSYTFATVRALVQEAGLECRRLLWPHPAGQVWIAVMRRGSLLPGNPDGNVSNALYEIELKHARDELNRVLRHPAVKWGLRMGRAVRRKNPGRATKPRA